MTKNVLSALVNYGLVCDGLYLQFVYAHLLKDDADLATRCGDFGVPVDCFFLEHRPSYSRNVCPSKEESWVNLVSSQTLVILQ